jgi:hypothetical protein
MHAIAAVRRCGGVLEHPADSWLFAAGYLPRPGHRDLWGGRMIPIEQADYGHQAIKPTWLYIVGPGTLRPGRVRRLELRPLENLSRTQRMATPPDLAHALVELARQSSIQRGAA